MTTPTRISAAPASWIGASVWSEEDTNDRTTMISGSTVLTSAACAAPMRRGPGVERLDRQERRDEPDRERARPRVGGDRRGIERSPGHDAERPRRPPRSRSSSAAVVTAASPAGVSGLGGVGRQPVAALAGQPGRQDDPDRVDERPRRRRARGRSTGGAVGHVDAAERQHRRRRPPAQRDPRSAPGQAGREPQRQHRDDDRDTCRRGRRPAPRAPSRARRSTCRRCR